MWLLEQPLYIVVIGIVLGILVGGAWSVSGRKELFYALGAVVVLTIVTLLVERLVVTDAEAIRAKLSEIARDVENNDHKRLMAHFSKGADPADIARAQAEMPNYEFTECRVTKIYGTDVDASAEPRSAKVQFNVIVSGTFRESGFEMTSTTGRWVELQMVKEDGHWRVQDYDHKDPLPHLFGQPIDQNER
jgi:hypothetical protein